jgi:DNA (cytosine-5)-methyltransferase 1
VQADALEFPLDGFDAIHASPPCPHYANVTRWRGNPDDHPALIEPVRSRLTASGLPYVIENVRTPELHGPFVLCGSMFDLPIRRHRYFETNWMTYQLVPPCRHRSTDLPFMHKGERAFADAMGCTWMSKVEGRDAIPPAYTEHIGCQLRAHIEAAAA